VLVVDVFTRLSCRPVAAADNSAAFHVLVQKMMTLTLITYTMSIVRPAQRLRRGLHVASAYPARRCGATPLRRRPTSRGAKDLSQGVPDVERAGVYEPVQQTRLSHVADY
jgi:hypothetical protein